MKLINNLTTENKKKKKTTNTSKARVNKNILKQWADENKKTDVKGSMGWFVNMNAGDVEHNIDFFNNMMGSSSSTDVGDSSTGTISSGDGAGISSGMAEEKTSTNSSSEELMEYSYKWKPSKQARREFAKKMQEIDDFCAKNNITQSRTSDSYYFDIDGQNYRVSNHSVEASNLHSGGKYHSQGREDDTIYIHASKTRLIDIYNDLKAGKKLDGRGNVISEEFISESKQDRLNFERAFGKELSDKYFKLKESGFFNNPLFSYLKDLYKLIKTFSPEDLEKELNNIQTYYNNKKLEVSQSKAGAELIYSKNGWKVYDIKTYEAAKKYGKHTKWCITGTNLDGESTYGDKYFNQYISKGVKNFYFVINSKDEKWCVVVYDSSINIKPQIFNQEDSEVFSIPGLSELKLPNNLTLNFANKEKLTSSTKKFFDNYLEGYLSGILNDLYLVEAFDKFNVYKDYTKNDFISYFIFDEIYDYLDDAENAVEAILSSADESVQKYENIDVDEAVDYLYHSFLTLVTATLTNDIIPELLLYLSDEIGREQYQFVDDEVYEKILNVVNEMIYRERFDSLSFETIIDLAYSKVTNKSIEDFIYQNYNVSENLTEHQKNDIIPISKTPVKAVDVLSKINPLPDYLYHATSTSNLDNIQKSQLGSVSFYSPFKGEKVVYLAVDKDTALEYYYRMSFKEGDAPVVLKIPVSILDLNKLYIDNNEEFYVDETTDLFDIYSFIYKGVIDVNNLFKKENSKYYILFESNQDKERFINYFGKELYNKFLTQKQRLPKEDRDLNKWTKRPPEDLAKLLTSLETKPTRSAARADDLKGATLVSENSSYKCYHITTYEASVIMGRGAKWCISMKNNDSYWKSYTAGGTKFYFFIGKNEKLALALYPKKITVDYTDEYDSDFIITNFELFNEEDENISYAISEYNLPQIPGVELVYIDSTETLDENGLYIDNNVVIRVDRNLTQVTIPEGVTEIGESAFKYCYSLENVNLPNSLLSIGDNAFSDCVNLTNIVIPNSVTTIGDYAFYGCNSLTDVVIPNSVTIIGYNAFSGCSSLTSIEIPNSVTTIGSAAFYNCRSLTNIEIPNSVTTIEGYAFSGCDNLKSVVIPDSVAVIKNFAFNRCNNLTIYCESTSQPSGWKSRWNYDNRPVVWGYSTQKQIKENINSYILEAKEDIIKFKNWLNNEDIFNLYYKLKSRLKSPYNDIYYVMKNMTQKEFSQYLNDLAQTKTSSQKRNEILDGAELVSENSEFKCYHITTHEASVLLGRNAQWCISMKDNARYWKSYTSKGIKFYFFIGKNDEKYALALYPRILKYEGLNANFELFNQQDKEITTSFKKYNFPKIPNVDLIFESKYTKDGLYIENNVLIKALPTITYAIVPEGVTEISRFAFSDCENLRFVELPNSLNIIGEGAFYFCKSLTSIEIPDSVTEIRYSAFNFCSYLKTVRLPKNLKEIGATTFQSCKSLTTLVIPNSVTTIGCNAFYGCSNLTSVVIPSSVTTIGSFAFYGCNNLTSIEIPNGVTTIGSFAFYDCNNLTIYCEASEQPKGWNSKWNSSNCPVVWGYSTQKQIKENNNSYDVWYRGFNADYTPLASSPASGQLYTWLTLDKEYAEEYAKDFNNGKIAVVTLNCSDKDIGSVFDLPDDIDYYAPSDEDFTEFILNENLYGYVFEVDDEYTCICIKKDMCNVIKILDIDNVEPEKTNNTEED